MKPSILEEVAVTCAEWSINVRLESIIVRKSLTLVTMEILESKSLYWKYIEFLLRANLIEYLAELRSMRFSPDRV